MIPCLYDCMQPSNSARLLSNTAASFWNLLLKTVRSVRLHGKNATGIVLIAGASLLPSSATRCLEFFQSLTKVNFSLLTFGW